MKKSQNKKNIKTKKCQPAAGDRPDLIQTAPVPSRGLARPQIKLLVAYEEPPTAATGMDSQPLTRKRLRDKPDDKWIMVSPLHKYFRRNWSHTRKLRNRLVKARNGNGYKNS